MNRYQFEVLAFLEKNGKNVYAIRTLSDKLKYQVLRLVRHLMS